MQKMIFFVAFRKAKVNGFLTGVHKTDTNRYFKKENQKSSIGKDCKQNVDVFWPRNKTSKNNNLHTPNWLQHKKADEHVWITT